MLKKGQVTVNGVAAKKPEQKIDEHKDQITCQGKIASYEKYVYYMLHKPAGVVSATEDKREKTVLDLLKSEDRRDGIFPVGRLDKDTEGFLLLTDDGDLAHRLSPRKHVDKTYYAKIAGSVTEAHIERFREGLDIGDEKKTLPAMLEILASEPETSEIRITIHEGRFHQVKRMFEAVGCKVTYLKRLSMGAVALDETLAPGDYRPLNEKERELLGIS